MTGRHRGRDDRLALITYARAAGARDYLEAQAWVRAVVDRGGPTSDPADLLVELDRLAARRAGGAA